MTRFRVLRTPDRWEIVQALLATPANRSGLEFWIRRPRDSIHRAFPVFLVIHSLAHRAPGHFELEGFVVRTRTQAHQPRHATCDFAVTSALGEMFIGER